MHPVLLVGFDGSAASRAAVELATTLAGPRGGRVVALTGYEVPAPVVAPALSVPLAELALEPYARHGAAMTVAELHVDGVEREIHPGGPAAALSIVAEREHAALIVVGTTHAGALGRLVPGSVAEQLVGGAPCAIAVAPEERPVRELSTIAVAYDRRPESEAALTYACDLALAHGARLRVLSVCIAPPSDTAPTLAAARDGHRERLVLDIAALVEALPEGLEATGEVLGGTAGHALERACADGVDLLVTGSRGYGPLRGALVGSVARHLVDHAPCPVLVVPRGRQPSA